MIDVEDLLRAELERLLPAVDGPDWPDVLRLAGGAERRRRRAALVGTCAIVAAAAAAVALATPLGAAIVRGLGGFSAWISGQPGSPAPRAQQQAFTRANAHSFLGFPAGTKLRLLETAREPSGQRQVQLLGFRAGGTLCLRVVVTGEKKHASRQSCAPLAELRHAGAPVRVVMVDDGFGQGTKHAWYGIDRMGAPAVQVTAGITADGVKAVALHDNAGTHTVRAVSNGFLYVAWNPGIGQRVDAISAQTGQARVDVPFAPAPWGGVGGGTGSATATGPTKVQRVLRSGTIDWLTRHQPVGQPLSTLQGRAGRSLRNGVIFGRLLNPNPNIPARFALTLSKTYPHALSPAMRHGPIVCGWTVAGSGAGGGCSPLKGLFAHGPISAGSFLANGSDEFMLVSGFVSDDVHRLVAYLSTGDTQQIAVVHNAFLASIARARFPIRLVAYDRQGRIVGLTSPLTDIGGGAGPAAGRAKPLLHVTAPSGATATLLVGRSNQGGLCTYVRYYQSRFAQGASVNCMGRAWTGSPVQLGGGGSAGIWYGRVRADVARVEVLFGDGTDATIHPSNGAVLYAVPPSESGKTDWVRRFTAYNAHGRAVGSENLKKPPPR